jgi:hypothetical protein
LGPCTSYSGQIRVKTAPGRNTNLHLPTRCGHGHLRPSEFEVLVSPCLSVNLNVFPVFMDCLGIFSPRICPVIPHGFPLNCVCLLFITVWGLFWILLCFQLCRLQLSSPNPWAGFCFCFFLNIEMVSFDMQKF